MRNDGVADIQFMNARDGRDRLNVRVVEAVACVHAHAPADALFHRGLDADEFRPQLGIYLDVWPMIHFGAGLSKAWRSFSLIVPSPFRSSYSSRSVLSPPTGLPSAPIL